jgi:hypothetical protein
MAAQPGHGTGEIWIDVTGFDRATGGPEPRTPPAAPGRSSKALWLSVDQGAPAAALLYQIAKLKPRSDPERLVVFHANAQLNARIAGGRGNEKLKALR